jgi:hypothetical protein
MPGTNFETAADDLELTSLLTGRMCQYFMHLVMQFLNETYFNGDLYACGISVNIQERYLYVDNVIPVDKSGNLLTSKELDHLNRSTLQQSTFGYAISEIDNANAVTLIKSLYTEHNQLAMQVFFKNNGFEMFYIDSESDFRDIRWISEAGAHYMASGRKTGDTDQDDKPQVNIENRAVAATGILKELAKQL